MDNLQQASRGKISSLLCRNQLSVFFVLTLASSAGVALIAAMNDDKNIAILTVLTPSLIAIVLTALVSGKAGLRQLLIEQSKQRVGFRWIAVSIVTIPLMAVVAIVIHSWVAGPALSLGTTQLLPQVVVIPLIALGEEYGWRGYALPRLQQRYSALNASLILGVVWGLWHFPGHLIGVGTPLDVPFYVFMLWVLAATILFTWVYNETNSVLMVILMHVAANLSFNYLPLLPEFTGQSITFLVFLALVWFVAVVVVFVFGPSRLSGSHSDQLKSGQRSNRHADLQTMEVGER